jgi:hypothetical protein
MATVIKILAGLAVLSNAVIYGTDVFGAIVQRPAMAAVDDQTLTQALGHIHLIADVRFKAIGIAGLIAAIATTIAAAVSGALDQYRSRRGRQPGPHHLPDPLHPDRQANQHGPDHRRARRPRAG